MSKKSLTDKKPEFLKLGFLSLTLQHTAFGRNRFGHCRWHSGLNLLLLLPMPIHVRMLLQVILWVLWMPKTLL